MKLLLSIVMLFLMLINTKLYSQEFIKNNSDSKIDSINIDINLKEKILNLIENKNTLLEQYCEYLEIKKNILKGKGQSKYVFNKIEDIQKRLNSFTLKDSIKIYFSLKFNQNIEFNNYYIKLRYKGFLSKNKIYLRYFFENGQYYLFAIDTIKIRGVDDYQEEDE